MIPLVDLKAQHDSIKSEIDAAISRVVGNSSFIMGEEVREFEKEFAKYCGNKFSIGASNGSTALYVVLKNLGLKEGDEVIMPVNTFIATAFAATLCGAKPVFVDVNESDSLINAEMIENKITPNTKIIIPVHLYGNVCDMDRIVEIAKRHSLLVVEDCAQAHGATYKGSKVPVSGIGCFSFFPAKILGAMGDAGAVVLDDPALEEKCRKFVNHGRKDKYFHDTEGFNFRIDGLQAAILRAKLPFLDEWVKKRRSIAAKYDELLKVQKGKNPGSSHYMYIFSSDKRDALIEHLKGKGVGTGIHYPFPLHLQPAFSTLGYKEGDFPIAESLAKKILSLPFYPELSDTDQQTVVDAIKDFG